MQQNLHDKNASDVKDKLGCLVRNIKSKTSVEKQDKDLKMTRKDERKGTAGK